MATTQETLDDHETRIAALEGSNFVSLDQVLKLTTLYNQNHSELSDALDAANAKIAALETNIRALNANRHNKRYELKMESPTLVSGNTYQLPSSYDPQALFVIFNSVVKVADSAITLAAVNAVDPLSKRFDCTTPLVAGAKVIYFEIIPVLSQPQWP